MSVPHTSGPKSRSKRLLTDGCGCTTALPVVLIFGFLWILIIELFGLSEKGPGWPNVILSKGHTRVEPQVARGDSRQDIASIPRREDNSSSLGPNTKGTGEWNALTDVHTAEAAHVAKQPTLPTVEVWNKGVFTPERRPKKR